MHRSTRVRLVVALVLAVGACEPATAPDAAATAAAPAATAASPTGTTPAGAAPSAPAMALRSDDAAVKAAIANFGQVRSYHAAMHIEGGIGAAMGDHAIDFVAPDRYRIQTPMGTQVVIGDTMYMDMKGHQMKVPMPKGSISQWRDPARLSESEADMTVRDDGTETLDGMATHKYLVHHGQPNPSNLTLWINGDDLPVQMRIEGLAKGKMGTSTIRYSRFNDPTLQIDPPR